MQVEFLKKRVLMYVLLEAFWGVVCGSLGRKKWFVNMEGAFPLRPLR